MTFLKHCKTGLLAFWLAPKNHGKSGLHHEHVAPQQTPGTAAALPHRLSATTTPQPRRARRHGGSQPRAQRPQPAEEPEGGLMRRLARFIASCIRLRSVSLALWVDAYDKAEVAK